MSNTAREWLEEWIDENINVPQYYESVAQMADQIAACRTAAAADGISDADLQEAADGDLGRFLLDAQNELTDGEVAYRAGKDD